MYSVAILAGGLGTRLGQLTRHTPKALVRVAGKPFIQHQLALLRLNDIRHVVVCTGHFGEQIEKELATVRDPIIDISGDGKSLLGTAGALRNALPLLGDSFFVLYGDSYLDCDYAAVQAAYDEAQEPALMTVCQENSKPNVEFSDGYVVRYDKRRPSSAMQHIDYGLSIWENRALASTLNDDLADVYRHVSRSGHLAGYEEPKRFLTIGTPDGLRTTERFIASR